MSVKEKIKNSRILYPIAHYAKAGVYWCWGNGAEAMFNTKMFLVKHGVLKEDERFTKIRNLKDKHKGQRCFVVATGPSLTIEDLDSLSSELTISMNSIVNVLDKTRFRPSYYLIQDVTVLDRIMNKIKQYNLANTFIGIGNLGKNCRSEISTQKVDDFSKVKELAFYHCDTASSWFTINFNMKHHNPKFSSDCGTKIYDGSTVTYSAIQLAFYMGCREVYLVGVDNNYSGGKTHFDSYDAGIVYDKADGMHFRMTKAYINAYQYAEKHGLVLRNATRGGMLNEIPRVDLDELLKKR